MNPTHYYDARGPFSEVFLLVLSLFLDSVIFLPDFSGACQALYHSFRCVGVYQVLIADWGLQSDAHGLLQSWRRGESWWSLVSEEELASMQAVMKEKIDNGTADAWIKVRASAG